MAQHFRYKKHPHHKKTAIKRFFSWLGLLVFLSFSTFLVGENVTNFQASILPTQQAPAFDGTVLPVQKAPNWVALTTNEWDNAYSQIPSSKIKNIPDYDPQDLRISTDSLVWGNSHDDAIRNAKITYSVAYMGSYRLNGKEYDGSHLAVDIKVPTGTPVYAIGNGIVTKASEQSSGFGKHLVIEHKNFPSYDNKNTKTTYHSGYAHLNSIKTTEGAVVRKGDLIGYVGSTGTSTTPHLHFQIDNNSAPWHPYWPFTSKEASNAGLSFSGAINAGLNQNIAIANTVNPMLYVQKYQDGSVIADDIEDPDVEEEEEESEDPIVVEDDPVTEEDPVVIEEEEEEEVKIDEYITFDIITGGDTISDGVEKKIQIKAVDENGDLVTNYSPSEPVIIEVIDGSATINPRKLTSSHFDNGVANIIVKARNSNPVKFSVRSNGIRKESPTLSASAGIFVDIGTAHPNFNAISFLKDEGIIQGYPDGSFKPDNDVSRVEVIKFILEGIDSELEEANRLVFNDTNVDEWYADYLFTAKNLGIVEGYPDGSFKPSASVNKVEFLKMLIEGANIDVDPRIKIGFILDDVKQDDWYAPYVQFALEKNLIDFDGDKFHPSEEIKRDAVAEAIYRIKVLQETGANQFTADLVNEIDNHAG